MCSPRRCRTCGKTTWAGCGNHIASVKAMVPPGQWCSGHADENNDSWLKRILGR